MTGAVGHSKLLGSYWSSDYQKAVSPSQGISSRVSRV